MDENHRLNAPDNDSLSQVEQLQDRSELSSIYPHAGKQWEGDLISQEERERRRQHKEDMMSFGIRKLWWKIGFLAPLPLVLLCLFLAGSAKGIALTNINLMVIPMIIVFLIWIGVTITIYRRIFSTFYTHALQALPFLAILYVLLALSVEILYILTIPIHQQVPLTAVLLVGTLTLLWSLVLSPLMLVLWTTPRVSGAVKAIIIAASIFGLLLAASTITFFLQ